MKYSKNRTLLNNIASLGIVQIVNYIFPLITIPYVSRILGPEGFGTINYITAFITYFVLIVNYGFDLTATRKIAVDPDNKTLQSKVFSEVTSARLLLFAITIGLFLLLIRIIPLMRGNLLLSIVLFFNVISALFAPQYVFQGLQKLSILSFLTILKGAINTVLILLLVSEKKDLLLYVNIGVFSSFLISLLSLLYVIFIFKLRLTFFSIKKSLAVLKEGRLVFFSSIIFSLYTTTNIIILGFFEEPKKIGFYTTAASFILIIQSVVNIPLSSSLYPYIGRSFAENKEEGLNKLRKILPLVFYFTGAFCLGILILAPFAITIIYGEKFEGSIISVQILSFLPLVSAMNSIMGIQTMLNLNMDKLFLRTTSFAAFFSLLLNFVMAYYFSYIGTSLSYLSTEIIICVLFYFILRAKGLLLFDVENFKAKNVIGLIKKIRNNDK